MGHARQCQPRVLPLRELSPSCKTTSQRVFPRPRQRSWLSEEPRQRAELVASGMGVRAPGCSLQTPPGVGELGQPCPSPSAMERCLTPCQTLSPFLSRYCFYFLFFFPCFPDPAEALNLPNASLPSYRRTGCGKLFFLSFLLD